MNIEAYREYCLSLGEDVEEKLPFVKFKNGEGALDNLKACEAANIDEAKHGMLKDDDTTSFRY